ncbi:MAG: HAMP domain-containing histidine kinase [Lachnospiraceae bacterium]|nr:HAMP domain-containing histidine kinase [Lachnospiraceae bacterium]
MNNKTIVNPFLRIFVLISVLLLVAVIMVIVAFYYIFGITEPEGLSLASWPKTFTSSFSVWMENDAGNIKIKDIGLERLDEYGLWLQVIDEMGKEVFSYNKPDTYPISYSASELIALSTGVYEQEGTVFVNSFEDSGKVWNYMVGFPYIIGKSILYYNGENVRLLSPVFRMGICFLLGIIIVFVLMYVFWLTRHLGKITKGIGNISLRSYIPLSEKGIFREIYKELNKMDMEIYHSDKVQKETKQARQEWIANITHDLKTPLSPIKGYAELLSDNPALESKTVQEYGKIILKNVSHTEKLINDLKLTYQLDAGAIPYKPKEIPLIRYLREVVIDIVNDPAFSGYNIAFESSIQEIMVCVDPDLFRRAVGNVIINALTHNSSETQITICVSFFKKDKVAIIVQDNGIGMSDEEQSKLFNRYYRGTSTREKPEGSGLGLAIAKQIVILHGGEIFVKSKQNVGTEFMICLPLES